MHKLTQILVEYERSGKANCPKCGEPLRFEKMDFGEERKSLAFKCSACDYGNIVRLGNKE